jgi:hypothetical protein
VCVCVVCVCGQFFTAGEPEVRCWTVQSGAFAPQVSHATSPTTISSATGPHRP